MEVKKIETEKNLKRQIKPFAKFMFLVMSIFAIVTVFSSILNIMSYNKLMNQIYTTQTN